MITFHCFACLARYRFLFLNRCSLCSVIDWFFRSPSEVSFVCVCVGWNSFDEPEMKIKKEKEVLFSFCYLFDNRALKSWINSYYANTVEHIASFKKCQFQSLPSFDIRWHACDRFSLRHYSETVKKLMKNAKVHFPSIDCFAVLVPISTLNEIVRSLSISSFHLARRVCLCFISVAMFTSIVATRTRRNNHDVMKQTNWMHPNGNWFSVGPLPLPPSSYFWFFVHFRFLYVEMQSKEMKRTHPTTDFVVRFCWFVSFQSSIRCVQSK